MNYSADRILGQQGMRSYLDRVRLATFGVLSPFRYNTLHYYFGQSFLYWNADHQMNGVTGKISNSMFMADLFLAKKLGRKVFMTLQGCDARLAGEGSRRNEWTMCAEGRCSAYKRCIDRWDAERRWLIANVLPFCDRVFYLNPELGHIIPSGTFLPYANVDIDQIKPSYSSGHRRLRIVHAPTDVGIKGTPIILNAIENLRGRYEFDFVLVKDLSHERALELYRSADLAIDQVLSGWYGGFAVEMMAMGKPVACYLRDLDMPFVPSALLADLPILRLHPDRLVDDLGSILAASSTWDSIGQRSRSFVERWHNPNTIAQRMLAAYLDPQSTFELESAHLHS